MHCSCDIHDNLSAESWGYMLLDVLALDVFHFKTTLEKKKHTSRWIANFWISATTLEKLFVCVLTLCVWSSLAPKLSHARTHTQCNRGIEKARGGSTLMMTARRPAKMMAVWKTSVHKTVFIPPYRQVQTGKVLHSHWATVLVFCVTFSWLTSSLILCLLC